MSTPQTPIIYVGLPPNISESVAAKLQDKLFIYFQKKQVNPYSDVDDVEVVSDFDGGEGGVWMKVTFSDQSGVEHVLAKTDHQINVGGTIIPLEVRGQASGMEVANCSDSDSDSFSVLQWGDADDGMGELSDNKTDGVTPGPVPSPETKGPSTSPNTAGVTPSPNTAGRGVTPDPVPSPGTNTVSIVTPSSARNNAASFKHPGPPHTDNNQTSSGPLSPTQYPDLATPAYYGALNQTSTEIGKADWKDDTDDLDMYSGGDDFPDAHKQEPPDASSGHSTSQTSSQGEKGCQPLVSDRQHGGVGHQSHWGPPADAPSTHPRQPTTLRGQEPPSTPNMAGGNRQKGRGSRGPNAGKERAPGGQKTSKQPQDAAAKATGVAEDSSESDAGDKPKTSSGPLSPTQYPDRATPAHYGAPNQTSTEIGKADWKDDTDDLDMYSEPPDASSGHSTSQTSSQGEKGCQPSVSDRQHGGVWHQSHWGPPADAPSTHPRQSTTPRGQEPPSTPNMAAGNRQMGRGSRGPNDGKERAPGGQKTSKQPQDAAAKATGVAEDSSESDAGDKPKDNLEDELPDEIEVNCGQDMKDDFLKLYFANVRRSGGGAIKTFVKDSKTGVIRVTFQEPQVASEVAGNKHTLSGADIAVKLVAKKKPSPIKKRCLLLQEIPDDWTTEHLMMFVENNSGMHDPKIQYGEMPGTAMCTFQQDIEDIDAVIQRIASNSFAGGYLRAEKICESDCVLVQGCQPSVSDRQHGGVGHQSHCGPPADDPSTHPQQPTTRRGQEPPSTPNMAAGNRQKGRESRDPNAGCQPLVSDRQHGGVGHQSHYGPPADDPSTHPRQSTTPRGQKPPSTPNMAAGNRQMGRGSRGPNDGKERAPGGQKTSKQPQGAASKATGVAEDSSESDAGDKPKDNLEDELPDEIEVNCGQDMKDDMLKLYFENGRRSGGGAIKTFVKDSKTGVIRVTFQEPQVASLVAGNKHTLSGADIAVKLVVKKKPSPIKKRCLLLQEIPDDCTTEHLMIFVENNSGMDELKIQYGEMPGTAMCTFQQDIEDIDAVIQSIALNSFAGCYLIAEKICESDCVLVQGFTSKVSKHMMECYFNNRKRSGGGGVRELELGPERGQAVVYFQDWKVVAAIMSRRQPHKLAGTELLVEEYHSILGRFSPLDAPTPHIPKPVSVGVPPDIMEFIYGKGKKVKNALTEELRKVRATLQWPDDGNKAKARLEPLLLTAGQRQSSWLRWPEMTKSQLHVFLSKCKLVHVPGPFWEDALSKIKQVDTRGISIETDEAHGHVVGLVGEQPDVDRGLDDINRIIRELKAKADDEAQQTKEEIVLSPQKLQHFTRCGIKVSIEKSFPDLKINIDARRDKKSLILEGTRKDCQEAELLMRRQIDQLETDEFKAGINKVKFVQCVLDKIHEVLGSRNIYAACSGSRDGKITIYGATRDDVGKTKAYIDQEIEEDTIPIKVAAVLAVLQSEKGMGLLDGINKQKFVMTQITVGNQQTGCIALAGFKSNLQATKGNIIAFLKYHVILKKLVPTSRNKVRLITTFHGAELTNMAAKNAKDHVNIQPQPSGRNKGFLIQGNESGVDAASQFITQLLVNIAEGQYPVSKTGMAQLFRDAKGKRFLESVEHELQCTISEDGEGSDGEDEDGEGAVGTAAATTEVLCRITLPPGGCMLRVCKGDLTKQKVDCIVNAANVDLKHIGGLANAILQAGGPIIQSECDQIMRERGQPLYVGEPVLTDGGKLPCKKVIHVAGPKWPHWKHKTNPGPQHQPSYEEGLLFNGVTECLKLANQQRFQSLAIPAISTGVYGFPVKLAARNMLDAVAQFCQTTPNLSLTEISFTNHDQPTCDVFKQTMMDQFGAFQATEADDTDVDLAASLVDDVPSSLVDDVPSFTPAKFTASGQNTLVTTEGVTVTLKKGSITTETVDVLVNTVASNLNLSQGAVSIAISQAAGPALQLECQTLISSRGQISAGTFVETGPGNLACKKVYHCVCNSYNPTVTEQSLMKLVTSLLEQAEVNEMASIAVPALGTGNLQYPADVSARAMYEAVYEFSKQRPSSVLKDVRFVVYDKDTQTIKGFEDEIRCLATGGTRGAVGGAVGGAAVYIPSTRKLKKSRSSSSKGASDRQSYSPIQRCATGMLQTKIGSVCLQLGRGDIVQETNDSIVNSVGPGLDLQGPVSRAILSVGGKRILQECDQLRKKGMKKLINVTGAGNLRCKHIFHVVTPRTAEEIKTIVAKTLNRAEDMKLKSISYPALGTGQLAVGLTVAECAGAMLRAVGEFAVQKKPRHLHLIRLVIFQQEMLAGFQAALDKEVGTSYKPSKGLAGYARSFLPAWVGGSSVDEETDIDNELQESIILQICAMDMSSIKKATDKIDKFQAEEYACEDCQDEDNLTDKMTKEHEDEVQAIKRKYNVNIELIKGSKKFYRIQGQVLNVKDAGINMQALFRKILKEEKDSQLNEHLWKEVQWKYSSAGGSESYEPDVNACIEKAYKDKKPSLVLDLEEGKVTINFQQMKEISGAGALDIHRVDLLKAASFEMPSNWIPMAQNEPYKMVSLTAGTKEYTDVQAKFQAAGITLQITEIQRIQNKELMMQYQARQAAIGDRLGRTDIEETLYHGTDEVTCSKINRSGFNRSFCGKHATVFGNGTYFAVNIQYSARDQYAKPNAAGVRHIYLTKVLVGDYTTGQQGMLTPPNKPSNPDQLYDCVVDNQNQPSIYVIFHDAQAYPEYLIKLQ